MQIITPTRFGHFQTWSRRTPGCLNLTYAKLPDVFRWNTNWTSPGHTPTIFAGMQIISPPLPSLIRLEKSECPFTKRNVKPKYFLEQDFSPLLSDRCSGLFRSMRFCLRTDVCCIKCFCCDISPPALKANTSRRTLVVLRIFFFPQFSGQIIELINGRNSVLTVRVKNECGVRRGSK